MSNGNESGWKINQVSVVHVWRCETEQDIERKYQLSGPPETKFLEDVRGGRVKLAKLARELAFDEEKLQASHSPNWFFMWQPAGGERANMNYLMAQGFASTHMCLRLSVWYRIYFKPQLNFQDDEAWEGAFRSAMGDYEKLLYDAYSKGQFDDAELKKTWTFFNSMFFCGTIYTTIGESCFC